MQSDLECSRVDWKGRLLKPALEGAEGLREEEERDGREVRREKTVVSMQVR